MTFKYHLVFVGVNKGLGKDEPLLAAERDAEELARAFRDLGLGGSNPAGSDPEGEVTILVGREATAANVHSALRAAKEGHDIDLLLVFWAGHFIKKTKVLVTTDTEPEEDGPGLVHLTDLSNTISLSRRARNRVLLLDVCYAGEVLHELLYAQLKDAWDGTLSHQPGETLLAVVSADANCKSFEVDRFGPLVNLLLPELKALQPENDGRAELGVLLSRVQGRLPGSPPALLWGDLNMRIPVSRSARPQPVGGRGPLEQAMGYAVQAFRDYLNANVVENVEVIYFLAYDVWDGCLVYDGLVHGSVEHRLLEYIRRQFLDGDRLRSRFEERRMEILQNGGPARSADPESEDDQLGAAGRCFELALDYVRENMRANPVRKLWYLGDLRKYKSEYQAYDRLLGLGSCLYIPVVGRLVPGSGRDFDAQERSPLGGILMAASRNPYGLKPKQKRAAELLESAKKPGESDIDRDIDIGSAIVEELLGAEGPSDREGGTRSSIEKEIDYFLQCIGGVYAQRAKERSRLRRLIHPQMVKGVVRDLEEGRKRVPHPGQIEKIAVKLERERASGRIPDDPVDWARDLARNGIGQFLPDDADARSRAVDLTWAYVTAIAWRDLHLVERKKTKDLREDIARTDRALTALEQSAPEPDHGHQNWDVYVQKRAEEPDDLESDDPNYVMQTGDSTKFHLRQTRRLIDDLRDLRDDPFTVLLQQLRTLAPVEVYLEGIAEVEAVLASSEREEYLRHLAHTVLVWLLGVWVLEASWPRGGREMDHAVTHAEKYVRELSSQQENPPAVNEWFSGDRLALFWGLLAAMHDLAEPVQRFAQWSQKFLERYFGGWSIQVDLRTPVLLDVLHHTRYPFYKNAITSLYGERERNWLESVFYAELVMWLGHPISGSLILVHEMEKQALEPSPFAEAERTTTLRQPQMWRRISDLLQPVLKRRHSEQGLLLPAYLAHGIAFSHLESIKAHWSDQYRKSNKDPKYLEDVGENFRVKFEDFPLTYLMGLCEVLLEPTGRKRVEEWELYSPPQEWLARSSRSGGTERTRPREEPSVEVTFEGSDPYTGLSPFFVRDVKIADPPPEAKGATAEPVIVITIALWLDGLERETNAAFRSGEIKQLVGKYEGGQFKQWRVLNLESFRASREKAMERAAAKNHDLPYSDDTCFLEDGEGALYVSRPAFEIMRMVRKLNEFKRHYRSKRGVEVRFKNVDEGEYRKVLAPLPATSDANGRL